MDNTTAHNINTLAFVPVGDNSESYRYWVEDRGLPVEEYQKSVRHDFVPLGIERYVGGHDDTYIPKYDMVFHKFWLMIPWRKGNEDNCGLSYYAMHKHTGKVLMSNQKSYMKAVHADWLSVENSK